jgi:pimeloyl-ACP methyl ester carboxylesterase
LAYEQVGSPDGLPVVYAHALLRGRLDALALDDAARATGVRLIAPDRPGVGGSTRFPDRALADWPADVAALADALEVERYAVLGWGLGGAYALACAAAAPARVLAVATVGCTIPADWPGMRQQAAPLERRLMSLRGLPLRAFLRTLSMSVRRSPHRAAKTAAEGLDRASAAVLLADTDAWAAAQIEALAQPAGVADDVRVLGAPWRIDLESVVQPVRLWQGAADTVVPAPWVVRLAEALPHAQVGALEGQGHWLAPARYEEILASLSAVARSAS